MPSSPIDDFLVQLHRRLSARTDGRVATYIPELAKVDPALFGIVVATVDGRVYEVGDARHRFTIQSISKPLVYGVALEDRGAERVRQAVGVEPSGEAFNSISLEPGSGRPMNPMINAGAIAMSSLVAGGNCEARRARVLGAISAYAGRPLEFDEAVFESERATGHRNRAIGHLLRNYEIIGHDPEEALDVYFHQCAVRVDCRDLALIGATLANGGVHPITGEQAVRSEFVGSILSVMATCGVYDFSGEWTDRVGLPAKSGVGGGIVAVLPGQLGIGVFSPALDERGNSVRGVQACEAISRGLGLHGLQPPRVSAASVRASYTLAAVRSKRRRLEADEQVLAEQGGRVRVLELQGDLRFTTFEPVLHRLASDPSPLVAVVLDFKRVTAVDRTATRMLAALIASCAATDTRVALTRVRRDLLAALDGEMEARAAAALQFHPQLDLGLEACERELLRRAGHVAAVPAQQPLPLGAHPFCLGAQAGDLQALEAMVERAHFEPGAMIVRCGEPGDAIYLLLRGQVSVVLGLPGGGHKRLATLTAGMAFGELALVTGGKRSADVRADTAVDCVALRAEALARLERERPGLAILLLRNMLQGLGRTALGLTAEVAALEG